MPIKFGGGGGISELTISWCLLTMSTSEVLRHLYSLDTSSPELLRYLYCLFQADEKEQYLTNLRGPELSRLVDFLDEVRSLLMASFQLTNGLCRPLVLSQSLTIRPDDAYINFKPSVETTRSCHPLTLFLVVSPELVRTRLPLAVLLKSGKAFTMAIKFA